MGIQKVSEGWGAWGQEARASGAAESCPLTPGAGAGQAHTGKAALLAAGRSRGSPKRRGTGYPGPLPQLRLGERAQPRRAPRDSGSHNHPLPGPPRPENELGHPQRQSCPFQSDSARTDLSLALSQTLLRATPGQRGRCPPCSWGCDWALATQPQATPAIPA